MEQAQAAPAGCLRQVLWASIASIFAAGLCEGLLRLADGGALPHPDCWIARDPQADGGIFLAPDCSRDLRGVNGPWHLALSSDGTRRLPGSPARPLQLVVGDSQVLGFGLNVEQTWLATAHQEGRPGAALAAPGWGVADALAAAAQHWDAQTFDGLSLVVNGSNDWADAELPIGGRYRLRGGWLLSPQRADRWQGSFFQSPLSRSHLLIFPILLLGQDWSEDPRDARFAESPWGEGRAAATARIANQILEFSANHPDIPLRVVFLPVDFETSAERAARVLPPASLPRIPPSPSADPPPWPLLARLLHPLPVVDLADDLRAPSNWMPADFHLSAEGHAALGRRLAAPHSPTAPNDDKP